MSTDTKDMKPMTNVEFRKCLIDMLVFIDEWCSKHDITYYLAYGTLLGAVRHKGLIPWDDDIDIAMPRKDYELFAKLFNEEFYENRRYRFVNIDNTSDYYLTFGKVIDNFTLLKERVRYNVDLGVYIDIFPIDNLDCGNGMHDTKRILKRIEPYCNMWVARLRPIHRKRTLMRNIISCIVSMSPLPMSTIIRKIDIIAREYENYPNPDKVGIIVHNLYRGKGVFNSEWFKQTIRMEFEGHMFMVPVGYHDLLTRIYGDYMTPPPEEERISRHDFNAYLIKV